LNDALFAAVREAASREVWSAGVTLARAGAVQGESAGERDLSLLVRQRKGMQTSRVVLHPVERDWSCDCAADDDPCAHVAAAVIALRRAAEEGRDLFAAEAVAEGRIGYRFARRGAELHLARVVVREGREEPLASTLAAVASGRALGPAFSATPADVDAERALGARLAGALPPGVMAPLLRALESCADVRLDGAPVRASSEPARLEARVEDDPQGFRLRVEPVPPVDERFANGVVRCGDALHPGLETNLTGRELAELSGAGRVYPPDRAAELVAEVIPELARRVRVELRSERLPRGERERPRLRLELSREGDRLAVLPLLVYGDPPSARVDAGQLVMLSGRVPLRDLDAERRLARALQHELELAPGHRALVEPEAAIALAGRLAASGAELAGDAWRDFRREPALVPRLELAGRGFALAFESPGSGGGARAADPARVLAAWRAGESLVPVAGGGFAELPRDWLARFGEPLADLLAARGADGTLPASALPDLARLAAELGQPPPPDFARLRALFEGFAGLPEPALPADLRADLRPYQRAGVRWLAFLRDAGLGALLADDMGLGKTLQALVALRGRTLVVAPTSVLSNWLEECARFRPGLRAALYHGPRRALDPEAELVVTSYAILRLDAERLAAERWDAVVLDEAQNVKNPDSQAARAAFALQAGWRLALSGTPVENRLEELWSVFHFLNPGLLGGRADFEARYARPIAAGAPAVAARLRERIRPFVLRRKKSEVAPELPPRTEVVLRCQLGDEERAVYDAVRAATVPEVVAALERGGSVLAALEALLRLRQAACHPALLPGQRAESSAKLDLLLEQLETALAEGHRALVFSQWTSLLDLVEPRLSAAGIEFSRLDGSTRDRAGVVARFQDEAGPPVLLVSLRAGGTGLNLTAADCVVLLDPWWNPAVEDQAADRVHRIGQQRPVVIYRLVAEDTVEEGILALQRKKRELADLALGDAQAAAALTRDDLLALLR
jgi:superfamily II DNA or RNA helicase